MTKIQGRGCKEDFQPNPSLLQNGQVSNAAPGAAEQLDSVMLTAG